MAVTRVKIEEHVGISRNNGAHSCSVVAVTRVKIEEHVGISRNNGSHSCSAMANCYNCSVMANCCPYMMVCLCVCKYLSEYVCECVCMYVHVVSLDRNTFTCATNSRCYCGEFPSNGKRMQTRISSYT